MADAKTNLMQNELNNLRERGLWVPTMNLRRRRRTGYVYPRDGSRYSVIEQLWVCAEKSKTEWRELPIVEDD